MFKKLGNIIDSTINGAAAIAGIGAALVVTGLESAKNAVVESDVVMSFAAGYCVTRTVALIIEDCDDDEEAQHEIDAYIKQLVGG